MIDSSDSILRGLIIDGFGVGVSIPNLDDVGDLVQGNFIGQYFVSQFNPITGAQVPAPNGQIFTGTGNSLQGVLLGSTNATIGGFNAQENNVITGNGQQGVSILAGAVGNQVLGNQIGIAGPSLGGRFAIAPNGADGVLIAGSSNVVGGASAGAGNLISVNLGDGVHISGAGATENQVEGNYIGLGARRRLRFRRGWYGECRGRRSDRECRRQHGRWFERRPAQRHLGQPGSRSGDHRVLGHRQHPTEELHRPDLGRDFGPGERGCGGGRVLGEQCDWPGERRSPATSGAS